MVSGFVAHLDTAVDVVTHIVVFVTTFNSQGDFSKRGKFAEFVVFYVGVVASRGQYGTVTQSHDITPYMR